jgi:AraC-like DNA-binding protein
VKTVFSTQDVHPRDRFDYWLSAACDQLVNHHSVADCPPKFSAELRSGTLANLGLVLFENAGMTIDHDKRQASEADNRDLFVCRQIAGAVVLEQENREGLLRPGDMMLIDPRSPYSGRFSADSKMLVLKVPRRLIEARVGQTREITACTINPSQAECMMTSAFLALLPNYSDSLSSEAEELVNNQVLDLIGISIAKFFHGNRSRLSSARSLALLKLRAAIETRLCDPALNAEEVASAAGVSVRYANAVLAEYNTSVMRLIQIRRLERCRIALEDPSQRHRTASDIAYSWGFSDMTHFGRKFRAAYGLLPSDLRKLTKRVDNL